MADDRVTPHDLDAERAVLGAVLVNNDYLHDVSEILTPGDFFRLGHRIVYETMRRLADKRSSIDFVTVKGALSAEDLAEAGGPAYLSALSDGVPRSANVAHYANLVKEKAIRRRLQVAADRAIRDACDAEITATEALERAEVAIYEIAEREQRGDLRSASSVVAETEPIIAAIVDKGRPVTGIPSGFTDLDTLTRGFQPGNLILIAARPAIGKTAIALNMAHHASVNEVHTAIFSLEMSRTELMIRLLTSAGRLDAHKVMSGNLHDRDYGRLVAAMAEIGAASMWIDDTSTLTVSSIRGKSRRMKAKRGLGLVVIDYLQLLSSERRYDSRVVEVGAMSRALKQLAKELDVPILCIAQLNRAPEARSDGRPKLADLRESGSLEQDADVVLLLHRAGAFSQDPAVDQTEAELIVAKSRNGPTGSVKLRWSREMTRFDNWSDRADPRLVR